MKMKWFHGVMAIFLAGVVAAQPIEGVAHVGTSSEKPGHISLWIQPVFPVLGTMEGIASLHDFAVPDDGFDVFVLPVGLSKPLSPIQELVFELTPVRRKGASTLYLAAGSSWMVSPNDSGGGFFVHLKLMGAVGDNPHGDLPEYPKGPFSSTQGQLSVGLDVGYRLRSGPLFVDLLLGGCVGVGFNVSSSDVAFGMLGLIPGNGHRSLVFDTNPHVVRVGWTF